MFNPECELNGTISGDRSFNIEKFAFGFDLKNDLFFEMNFNPNEKLSVFSKLKLPRDAIIGGIYKIT